MVALRRHCASARRATDRTGAIGARRYGRASRQLDSRLAALPFFGLTGLAPTFGAATPSAGDRRRATVPFLHDGVLGLRARSLLWRSRLRLTGFDARVTSTGGGNLRSTQNCWPRENRLW